jgi:hypothetical protein
VNPRVALGLTEAQWTALALGLLGGAFLIVRRAWRPAAA